VWQCARSSGSRPQRRKLPVEGSRGAKVSRGQNLVY
jgi:hypothetical protein